jgi:hypothetical protein
MEGCWLLKWTCLKETTHKPLHLYKPNFAQWKLVDMPTSFIGIIIFINGTFEYGDGGIFKLLSWMQNLRQQTWGNEIFYSDRSSRDKQN